MTNETKKKLQQLVSSPEIQKEMAALFYDILFL